MQRLVLPVSLAAALVCALDSTAVAQREPDARMLRYPAVSRTHIAFVYANDVWIVPRDGGAATPLASPPGQELFPRFSPDGRTIAFAGNYDGGRDLYTVPIDGGVPFRVTYHPAPEFLCGWTPEGSLLFYRPDGTMNNRWSVLFTVSPRGGLPRTLPVPYGANASISFDNQQLAYTPHTHDFRTWKRHRGGMATDIWVFHLTQLTAKRITTWEGTDTLPMWHGRKIYYLSDAGTPHRLNIWLYDTDSEDRRQVTSFTEYDVKWPSIGPGPDGGGEIVFQCGSRLYLLDLRDGRSRPVTVIIPGDRPALRKRAVAAGEHVAAVDISATGKRAIVEARGDVWTLPAKEGAVRNLTRTDGAAERSPSWSPDGRWVAYFSDASGEYELCVAPADGSGEAKQLTRLGPGFRFDPRWSPDSGSIAFTDRTGRILVFDRAKESLATIDQDPWAEQAPISWSHDSRWLAYVKGNASHNGAIWLYEVQTGAKRQLTSGVFDDQWPTFDRRGDYLFYASARRVASPTYDDASLTFVYAGTQVLLAVPLRETLPSPFAPKSDEEGAGEAAKEPSKGQDRPPEKRRESFSVDPADPGLVEGDSPDAASAPRRQGAREARDAAGEKKEPPAPAGPLTIDLAGFERRAIELPVSPGRLSHLAVNHEGKLLYVRHPVASGKDSIKLLDLADEKREEKTVADDLGFFRMSADGKTIVVRKDRSLFILEAGPDQKLEHAIQLNQLLAEIDPRAEWRQIFTDAWRIQRDFFYDPNMHGVDWKAACEQYRAMLDDCVSREDVSYVIGELISEINAGHTYYSGGDVEEEPRQSVGMLGADFELKDGAYRLAAIRQGAPWDSDARGPLSQPGIDVKEGDFVLAVNGVPIDPAKDPYAAFVGLADRVVALTVSERPVRDALARTVVVKLLGNDNHLRFRAWIEKNRAFVDAKTGGRVGYIYVPDTGVNGQNELFRQFFGQIDKQALIIDERWNGGGQIPSRFIELLNRPITNYWARRDGNDWPWPPNAHHGPKCMLINGLAGSGGDAFPAYFRQAKLGKLIGRRTWGGLIGISGNPRLIDGGYTSAPTFAYYEPDGTWGIEGHGVDPDIEVIDDPSLMARGADPQLDAAIAHLLEEIEKNPYRPPARPAYPDRSGMGIREEDK